MSRLTVAGIALVATVSAASGWLLGSKGTLPRPAPDAESTIAPTASAADRVRVFSDGTVSIQLSKAPLHWLWDELARQGGGPPIETKESAPPRSTSAPVVTTREDAGDFPAQNVQLVSTDVLRTLREGNQDQRLAALQEADSARTVVPAELLQKFIDSDPSDQVRLQALKAYVDSHVDDADAVSQILDAGRSNPSAAVRAESQRRLEMFDQSLHVQTAGAGP
jgi:hypothetical protein